MSETTRFPSNGKSINTDLFKPTVATASDGVIIIAHGTDGLLDPWGKQILDYGEALAKEGFVALVPHYFDSTGTAPGFRDPDPIALHAATWQQTLTDAVAHALTLPGVDPARVGLLGFSLGGHLCLRLRSMAKVLVEFFAPALSLAPAKGGKLHAQVHHGESDDLVPLEDNLPQIVATLQREGAALDVHQWPKAGHGFIGTDQDNTRAREESRKLTIKFFADHL